MARDMEALHTGSAQAALLSPKRAVSCATSRTSSATASRGQAHLRESITIRAGDPFILPDDVQGVAALLTNVVHIVPHITYHLGGEELQRVASVEASSHKVSPGRGVPHMQGAV